jgi:hypothetical protein
MNTSTQTLPIEVGAVPVVRTLRNLLEAAGEARRSGDRGLAEVLEGDAVLVLRTSLQSARRGACA